MHKCPCQNSAIFSCIGLGESKAIRSNQKYEYSSPFSQSSARVMAGGAGVGAGNAQDVVDGSLERQRDQLGDAVLAGDELGAAEEVFDLGLGGHTWDLRGSLIYRSAARRP